MKPKLKKLLEQRNALMDEMDTILAACETEDETRAFTEDESKRFGEIETEIRALDEQIKAIETREALENEKRAADDGSAADPGADEQRALDEQAFLNFIRGVRDENRALDVGNNGGVIPTHIADKIIDRVRELSPIFSMATVYNVGGDLVFPVYDESASSVSASFVEDLTELTEGTGKFTTVKLQNFIVGCLAKISRSLMNRTDFDLIGFIVNKVAQKLAEFLEEKLIQGATNKNQGVLAATQVLTLTSSTAITADDLIDLQMEVVQPYQANASWIMHKNTFKVIRKLKDSTGEYLLNKDVTAAFGWQLLGKPVYITESMPTIAAGASVIAYGDMSGLYVKLAQGIELQILNEKYATQHATGVVGYVEFDSKIVEPQKIALMKMKATS